MGSFGPGGSVSPVVSATSSGPMLQLFGVLKRVNWRFTASATDRSISPVTGSRVPVLGAADPMLAVMMAPLAERYDVGKWTPSAGTLIVPSAATVPAIVISSLGWNPGASSLWSSSEKHCGSSG